MLVINICVFMIIRQSQANVDNRLLKTFHIKQLSAQNSSTEFCFIKLLLSAFALNGFASKLIFILLTLKYNTNKYSYTYNI